VWDACPDTVWVKLINLSYKTNAILSVKIKIAWHVVKILHNVLNVIKGLFEHKILALLVILLWSDVLNVKIKQAVKNANKAID